MLVNIYPLNIFQTLLSALGFHQNCQAMFGHINGLIYDDILECLTSMSIEDSEEAGVRVTL